MKIGDRYDEGVLILELEGKLTIGDGDVALRERIDEAMTDGEKKIVVDLGAVKAMDSSGLGELLRLRTVAAEQGAGIKLVQVGGGVQEVLEMTRLIGVFEIYGDALGAVAAFREK